MTAERPPATPQDDGGVPVRFRLLDVLSSLGATSGSSLHWGVLGDGTPVLVKRVEGVEDPRVASGRLRRERELFELLARAEVGPRPLALLAHPVAPALVLEDRPGGLLERILASRRLETAECLEIGADVAAALAELHAARVIHGDVRPANVLVGKSEGGVRTSACLVDLSRAVHEGSGLLAAPGEDPAYLAPERTGRFGRGVDGRSDLYSLGVLLYLLLTGQLPFTAGDRRGWVHCHVARPPRPPAELGRAPRPLSDVVLKLLAKLPDDRYQTAEGVRQDLEECLRQHRAGIERPFTVAARDRSGRFQLPARTYGRDRELEALLRAQQRTAESGRTAVVLVGGPSGIGKTALVEELRRRLAGGPVQFGAGRFDRDRRRSGHAALGAAVAGVVEDLASAGEEEAARWRALILEALGNQARLLAEAVPPLAVLLGPQPPVPGLPPREAQRRFARAWQRFLAALARPEHPLVLFLDDLQWADAEALSLLRDVAGDPDTHHLLLVGAYRDGEVEGVHPLRAMVDGLREQAVPVESMSPGPLAVEDVARLLGDGLSCEPARVQELAAVVHARAAGNPFLVVQLSSALVEEGLITFQRAPGEWRWELARVQARPAEDVAALLAGRLGRLPEATRRVLRLAGSLGNGSQEETLALADGRPREEVERDLSDAARRGLLRTGADGTFELAHERVEEAARALTPEEERPRVHHALGRALLARWGRDRLGDRAFEVIRHLRLAAPLLAPEERLQLAELELEAGRTAQAAMAHTAAAEHFAAGQRLLPPDAWSSAYPLASALTLERARAEWLRGDHAAAEEWIAVLLREAHCRAERAEAYRLRIDLLTTRNDVPGCVNAALEACAQLYGLEFPLHPGAAELEAGLGAALQALQGRSIEQQLEAPDMADPDERALVALVSSAAPTAFFLDPMLHDLMTAEVARRILLHGNSPYGSHPFACFAVAVGHRLGRWAEAFRLSAAACALADRYGSGSKAGCHFMAGVLAQQVHPPGEAARAFRAAWQAAVDGGDLNHGCYAGSLLVRMLLASGAPLEDVAEEARRQLDFARSARVLEVRDRILAMARFVESLRGGTRRLGSFEGPGFDPAAFEARLTPAVPMLSRTYHGYGAFAALVAGDFAAAAEAAARVRALVPEGAPIDDEYFWVVHGLAVSGRADQVAPAERPPLLDRLRESAARLRALAAQNPRTFTAGLSLVAAELARQEGRGREALNGYEGAMAAARQEGYPYLEALAAEAAARWCRQHGWSVAATAYLRAAWEAYRRWGAAAKVAALVAEHPELQAQLPRAGVAAVEGAGGRLDVLAAAARVSQAISGEVNLQRLVETLLRTVVEAAGAQYGSLLLDGAAPDVALVARATVRGAEVDVKVSTGSPAGADELPASILAYTRRTHEPVVLWDATAPNPYADDAALRRRGARSVVCLPILRRGTLEGLLYLETDAGPTAFTPERLPLLELLAAHTAISLELSRHRERLEQLVARRTTELTRANESLRTANRKLELAHRQLLQSEKMASIGRLAAGVAHEINNPVAYAASNLKSLEVCVGELLDLARAGADGSAAPGDHAGDPAPADGRLAELRTELGSVIGDTRYGLDRVATIVRALRTFSYLNESAWQVTDVRLGLESALHLLRGDLERKAVVVVEHGETPPVECLPSELNQVFMNLLLNAAQAIPDRGTVTVRSGVEGEDVWIEVSDTGAGIAPENLSRIFDPFFTTKPVGEGTGLGLALAYGIIEKHHGRIDVASELGKGTTFRLWLPVRQPTRERA